jgi:hypothetical protein
MIDRCVKCGTGKYGREMRRSKKPNNRRNRYLALEREVEQSNVVRLHRNITGVRNLCYDHLRELVEWLRTIR